MIALGAPSPTLQHLSRQSPVQSKRSKILPGSGACRFFVVVAAGIAALVLWPGCQTTGMVGAGAFHTVVLDAGHGAHDPGARALSGMSEKAVALDTAIRVRKILERRGMRVVMTRSTDVFIPLSKRVAVSNRIRGSIFVSIHYNWVRYPSGHGVETFWYSRHSERLAANIQRDLARSYRTANRGIKHRGFYVIKNNSRPAVLVECGFLSNPSDNRVAQSSSGRQKIADAIARGIIAERQGRRP